MTRAFAGVLAILSLFFGLTTFAQTPTLAPEQTSTPAAEKSSTPAQPAWRFLGDNKKTALFIGKSVSGKEELTFVFVHGQFDSPHIEVPGDVGLKLLEGTNPKGSRNSKVILTFDDGAPVEQKLVASKLDKYGTFLLVPYTVKAQEALGEALYQCKKFSIVYYPEGKAPVTAVFNMADLTELTKGNKIKPPHKHSFDFKDAMAVAGVLGAL